MPGSAELEAIEGERAALPQLNFRTVILGFRWPCVQHSPGGRALDAFHAGRLCPVHAGERAVVLSLAMASLLGGLRAGILASVVLPAGFADHTAEQLFREGLRAQRAGRHIEAYLLYSRARALDPANPKVIRAARGVRRGAAQLLAAAGEYRMALEMAPDSWEFQSLDPESAKRRPPPAISGHRDLPLATAPPKLRYSRHRTSFRFRGTLRESFLLAAEEFGVRIVFDRDFEGEAPVRADLTECDFPCAVRALGEIGTAFVVPLDSDLLYVADDSQAGRTEYETAALVSIPVEVGLASNEVSEVAQAIQQVLDLRHLHGLSSGTILARGSVAKVNMARRLVQDLLHPPGSAQIEVQMITVSSSGRRRFGIDLPTAFSGTNFSTLFGASPDAAGSERLIGVGGGKTVLGISVGDASILARLDASTSESIGTMHLRSAHAMPAEFKVGERYPVATAQYSPGSAGRGPTGTGSGSYIQPAPSISFEDLGLNLSVTPLIHSALDVTLLLEVNFRFLAGSAVNDIPVVSNREFQSQVRLRQGEFAIVSGMTIYERRRSRKGLSGLARLPWLRGLFRRHDRRWSRRDLLILVRPRVVRLPPSEVARSREFLFGPEQRPVPAL